MRRSIEAILTGFVAAALAASAAAAAPAGRSAKGTFRVCADPNNLPFSNKAGEGFENKLAELLAADLGEKVSYTWWAQRRGFVRNTLKAKQCDVVMGVPAHYDMVLTTRPYYRSTYVFVWRKDRDLHLSSMKDPRLRQLRVGVTLVGDDGAGTPPGDALGVQGIASNVVGYPIYGDYRKPNPPAAAVEAVASGKIDVAAVWGPVGGYFAKRAPVPMTVVPINDTASFAPLRFQYSIAMGVRKGDHARRDRLDALLVREAPRIRELLQRYGVPLVPIGDTASAAVPAHQNK